MTIESDVAIVGYGPVGQLLAILLAQRGRRVAVLERWPEPYPLPRAVHFDHEIARVLQGAGVMPALEGRTESASIYEWRNAAGEILLRFGRETGSAVSGWPESSMFCQPELEQILDARAQALGVTVLRGCEATSIDGDAQGVSVDALRSDGSRLSVRARYGVGCDGANSGVREQLDVSVVDLGFAFDWLVVDLVPSAPREWSPINWQLCDPARPTTLVSGGPGRRRWEFMRLPGEDIDELNTASTAWRLLAPWGVRPDNARLERHAVYTFRGRWVEPWRRGRLAARGRRRAPDAALRGTGHVLGAARRGESRVEARPGARRSRERCAARQLRRRTPPARARDHRILGRAREGDLHRRSRRRGRRDASMVPAAQAAGLQTPAPLPAIGPGCFAGGDAHAGRLFVQDVVRTAGREGRFDDVVGGGFVLASPHADPARFLDAATAAGFAAIGGRTAHVAAGAAIDDAGGGYARWFAESGASVALQRPDFYVFGTAARVEDSNALADTLLRTLRR